MLCIVGRVEKMNRFYLVIDAVCHLNTIFMFLNLYLINLFFNSFCNVSQFIRNKGIVNTCFLTFRIVVFGNNKYIITLIIKKCMIIRKIRKINFED